MSMTFEQGRSAVAILCRHFAINQAAYLAPGVKEAHVRQKLIDPFFEALGWDVANRNLVAPQYCEVVSEVSLDVEGQQKAPDYAFRVGTLPKFYVEAKKCGVDIHHDPAPAFQLRRYGWSGKVAVSILTSFQELAVYDCMARPKPSDKASHARILYFGYNEYPDRWRELWDVFSREAVWSGAFDQYAASKRKRGTTEVDVEFLKEIEGWRDALARNMALRNARLSSEDLSAAVQRTIDRIVFLRMAEDRGLEPYEQLLKLCERDGMYARFMRELCRKTDEKYNSGLFHFQQEAGVSEAPDRITPKLLIDDKVFKSIIQGLYFAHGSPYHFGVLPVEILGTVYERFLGKVIRLTPGHQAKIEEKPEVRKAGGVYYTPAYIVEYIVRETVGRQIEGRSPTELSGGKSQPPFRVLDMACGSGSFLLGAYQFLLDHCLKWYIDNKPDANKKAVYKDPRGAHWRLTIEEKKRILTTHLFGVDIDPQAVEVSKLSLLLKALEGETDATLSMQLRLFHDRALPNLSDNIKCGNSLIGPDYFLGALIPDAEEMKRVNPFDWQRSFPKAFGAGGFDCVIGNPPYGMILSESFRSYLDQKCPVFAAIPDAYVAFFECAHHILRQRGRFGYVIPSAWLGGPGYAMFRKFVLGFAIESIIQLPFDVFKDAYIDTVIVTTRNVPPPAHHAVIVHEYGKREKLSFISPGSAMATSVPQHAWSVLENNKFVFNVELLSLMTRLRHSTTLRLSAAVGIKRGVLFDASLLTDKQTSENSVLYFEGDIYRYQVNWKASRWVEYGVNMRECPKSFDWFEGSRILLRRLVNRKQRLMAAWTDQTIVTNKNLYVLKPIRPEAWQYILAILNSRLVSRLYVAQVSGATKDDFPQVTISDLSTMPYRGIDFSSQRDKNAHDRLVALVDSILAWQRDRVAANSAAQQERLQRQIDATDVEIDRLVYELYGLTEQEIKTVEGFA